MSKANTSSVFFDARFDNVWQRQRQAVEQRGFLLLGRALKEVAFP